VSWTILSPAVQPERSAALELAGRYVGVEPPELAREDVTVNHVRFNDEHGFGDASVNRSAVHVFVPALRVEGPDTSYAAWVSVNLVFDDMSGVLLAAFTSPASKWAIPALTKRDPEASAAKAGWSTSAIGSNEVHSTVPDVLSALWSATSLHPDSTGQIVMRPRTVSALLPKRLEEVPEGWIPSPTTETRWIVEVLGAVTHVIMRQEDFPNLDGDRYMTGMLILVRDNPTGCLTSVFMP
jgi:hypothetical protein